MNRIVLLLGVVVLAGGLTFWWMQRGPSSKNADLHARIESKIELTDAQKSELPEQTGGAVALYRTQTNDGAWDIVLGKESEKKSDLLLGYLDEKPSGDDVARPVYLCVVEKSRTLCLTGEKPLGYVSKQIRNGFRLLVRCFDPDHGIYLSLNSRCESPDHRPESVIGAIRAEL